MSNNNDKRILELKKNIQVKKEQLKKINRGFTPITSCIFELDGIKYNINVLDKNKLITLAVKLNSLIHSAKDIGVEKEFIINGFLASDFMEDVCSKLESVKYKEEKIKLDSMEYKLNQLLSEEKQVELELDEIASML